MYKTKDLLEKLYKMELELAKASCRETHLQLREKELMKLCSSLMGELKQEKAEIKRLKEEKEFFEDRSFRLYWEMEHYKIGGKTNCNSTMTTMKKL